MSRDRFYAIMSALRFDDVQARQAENQENEVRRNRDRLLPIRALFNQVVSRFAELYIPASKLCVDEQLVSFRGRCPFRVYMPDKPKKYGIKIWALTDNSSGYILKLQVYEGRRDNREVRFQSLQSNLTGLNRTLELCITWALCMRFGMELHQKKYCECMKCQVEDACIERKHKSGKISIEMCRQDLNLLENHQRNLVRHKCPWPSVVFGFHHCDSVEPRNVDYSHLPACPIAFPQSAADQRKVVCNDDCKVVL